MARLLANPPCRVLFAGWESDTYSLGRAGWKIALEEHPNHHSFTREFRMILNYPEADLHAVATAHARDADDYRRHPNAPTPIFQVRQMFSRAMVRFIEPVLVSPQWVNTVPHMMEMSEIEWKQQPLFQQVNTPVAEELIVEPATVAELLDQIRHMQAPEQAAIRARQRRNADVPQMHASIISFPRSA
jgi:hypothetical protein